MLDFFKDLRIIIFVREIEDLCNGSTPDSDSVCGGSNPSSSANKKDHTNGVVFFIGLGWGFEKLNRDMPVAYRCHQFKNWWLPIFFIPSGMKNANESLIRPNIGTPTPNPSSNQVLNRHTVWCVFYCAYPNSVLY